MSFPVEKVRADFPVLTREVNGLPLAYLDSAASAQKPNQVWMPKRSLSPRLCRRASRYSYPERRGDPADGKRAHANCRLPQRPLAGRAGVCARHHRRDQPGGQQLGQRQVGAGDNIIITQMEHHANIVPWQMLCERVGAQLRVIPLNPDGTLQLEQLDALLDDRTRLVAVTQVSNVLGTENPVADYRKSPSGRRESAD
jgi:cysteine desulfurase/selenocysteine lyase